MPVSHSIHSFSSSWDCSQANNESYFCLATKLTKVQFPWTYTDLSPIQVHGGIWSVLYSFFFGQHFVIFLPLCSGNKNATVSLSLHFFSPFLLPSYFNQSSPNRAVLLVCFSPKWNVTPKSSRCWKLVPLCSFLIFVNHKIEFHSRE